jgi:hypothetical protein
MTRTWPPCEHGTVHVVPLAWASAGSVDTLLRPIPPEET